MLRRLRLLAVILILAVKLASANSSWDNTVAYFCAVSYDQERAGREVRTTGTQYFLTVDSASSSEPAVGTIPDARFWTCTVEHMWAAPLERGAIGCWQHVTTGLYLAYSNSSKPVPLLTKQCNSTLNMFTWKDSLNSALKMYGYDRYLVLHSLYTTTSFSRNPYVYRWNTTSTAPPGSYPPAQQPVSLPYAPTFCITFDNMLFTQFKSIFKGMRPTSTGPHLSTRYTECMAYHTWQIEQRGGAFVPLVYLSNNLTGSYLSVTYSGLETTSDGSSWLLHRVGDGYQLQSLYNGKYLNFKETGPIIEDYGATVKVIGKNTNADGSPIDSSGSTGAGSSLTIVGAVVGLVFVGAVLFGVKVALRRRRSRPAHHQHNMQSLECPMAPGHQMPTCYPQGGHHQQQMYPHAPQSGAMGTLGFGGNGAMPQHQTAPMMGYGNQAGMQPAPTQHHGMY